MPNGRPDIDGQEDIEDQLGLIRHIKEQFDIEDTFLAALLANQIQLSRIERAQNDLLRNIRDGPIGGGDGDNVPDITPEGIRGTMRGGFGGTQLSFPANADVFGLPAAPNRADRIEIDFSSGDIRSPSGNFNTSVSLDNLNDDRVRSLLLWADVDLRVFSFAGDDTQTGVWKNDKSGYIVAQGASLSKLEIEADTPFNTRIVGSTSPISPMQTWPVSGYQERFGHITTTDQDFTSSSATREVQFVPPRPEDYGQSDLPSAASEFGDSKLETGAIGQTVMILEEVANNANAEIQLREWNIDGEQEVADNDVHGNVGTGTGNTVTVPQNDFAVLETSIHSDFKKLMCQSADGSEVELRVQYRGYAPGMRA